MPEYDHISYLVAPKDMDVHSAIVRLPDRSCRVWLEPGVHHRVRHVGPLTYEVTIPRERVLYYGLREESP